MKKGTPDGDKEKKDQDCGQRRNDPKTSVDRKRRSKEQQQENLSL